MKKIISFFVLFFLCLSLFSYNKDDFFSLFFSHFENFTPNDKPVVLEVEAGEISLHLKNKIKEYLLDNSYQLLDSSSENCNILRVHIDKNEREKIKRSYLKKRLITKTDFSVSFEIISNQSREISKFKVCDFELSETKKVKSGDKWYDPLMISAIVGGLVYLFYYGNS